MKNKETLEETAEKQAQLSYYGDEVNAFVRGSVFGAKWQKEQYTIEEQHVGHTIDELSKEYIKGFNEGSAWQQERSYSEEEVSELVYNIIGQYANQVNIMIDGDIINRLFEQFKK